MSFLRTLLVFSFTLGSAFAAPEVWEVDPAHSSARFSIRHLMISNVKGEIGGIKGRFTVDPKDLATLKIETTLDPATISTQNPDRDKHLRDTDFFSVAKFPTITFKSKKVTKKGDKFEIVGELTMRGVTKTVTLDSEGLSKAVTDPWGNQKRGFSATTKINRKDFGMTWNKAVEAGGVVVGDEAKVEIEMELQGAKKEEKKKG